MRTTPGPAVQSESWFRALLDSAPVMIWMSGPDASCTYFNRGWLAYTGRRMEDELGDGWAKGVHPDDLPRCLETYVSHFKRREPFRMEYRLMRANGEYGWILDDGAPRYAEDGAFLGFVGSCVDVTDQKSAESALRSQTVTKAFARRLLHDLIGRARIEPTAVRDFGRAVANEQAEARTPEAFAQAFEALGFGRLSLAANGGKRYEFTACDLLEKKEGALAPTCHLTLGYLEGAVGALSGRHALGTELTCQSVGHAQCRFVVMAQ